MKRQEEDEEDEEGNEEEEGEKENKNASCAAVGRVLCSLRFVLLSSHLFIAAPHQRVHAVPHFQPRDAVVDGPQHVVVLPDEVLQQRLPSLLELLLRCPMQRPIGN